MTVQPRDRSVSIAASPVEDGAEPPDWSNTRVPVAIPDVTSDTRMLSMLVCVSAVLVNASVKFPPFTLSNSPAGIVVRLEQKSQADLKVVPEDVLMRGKLVRLEQKIHESRKLVPEDVSRRGKLVRLEQSNHAARKSVPDEVLIKGKLVRLEQPCQADRNLVPDEVSIKGKLVISDQSFQKLLKSVTAP